MDSSPWRINGFHFIVFFKYVEIFAERMFLKVSLISVVGTRALLDLRRGGGDGNSNIIQGTICYDGSADLPAVGGAQMSRFKVLLFLYLTFISLSFHCCTVLVLTSIVNTNSNVLRHQLKGTNALFISELACILLNSRVYSGSRQYWRALRVELDCSSV